MELSIFIYHQIISRPASRLIITHNSSATTKIVFLAESTHLTFLDEAHAQFSGFLLQGGLF